MYVSEFTRFMDEYLAQHPDVETERRRLRLTRWDTPLDLDEQQRWSASRVPQKPYVYQPD